MEPTTGEVTHAGILVDKGLLSAFTLGTMALGVSFTGSDRDLSYQVGISYAH